MRYSLLFCAALLALVPTVQAQRVAKAVAANAPDVRTPGRTASSVVLRANDMIELRLTGMPPEDAAQFAASPYTVSGDGTVNIPYAGMVQAAGRTPSEVERAIERALVDKKIFRWPAANINLNIGNNANRFVTVGGAVRAPGRIPWSPDLTLMSAISAQGGPGDFAHDKIHLIRGGAITVYSFKKLQKDPSQDPRLQPSDQIDQR